MLQNFYLWSCNTFKCNLSSIFSLTRSSVFIWPARESLLFLSLLLLLIAFPVPFPVCALIRSSRESLLFLSSFSLSWPGPISVRPSGDSPSFVSSVISSVRSGRAAAVEGSRRELAVLEFHSLKAVRRRNEEIKPPKLGARRRMP